MPLVISLYLIQYELRNPAEPLAIDATKELIIINLLPVTLAVIPENNFLSNKATVTDEPTAAPYPKPKS